VPYASEGEGLHLSPIPEALNHRQDVAGPVEREVCVKLFTDPRMQKAFAMWKKH
jgi:hypothetical protein